MKLDKIDKSFLVFILFILYIKQIISQGKLSIVNTVSEDFYMIITTRIKRQRVINLNIYHRRMEIFLDFLKLSPQFI